MREGKIRLGVSRCLLGEAVRYDGQHKRNPFIADTLGRYFECIGVCPEVECGLGVPRAPLRLVGDPAHPRPVMIQTGADHTDRLQAWMARRIAELDQDDLYGFIFKARSPSCSLEPIAVYNAKGIPVGKAPGLFAKIFSAHFPTLPCEDDQRLNDPNVRENFIERIFALWRFRRTVCVRPSVGKLMMFHARNKLLIQAHHETLMRELGRELAGLRDREMRAYLPRYEAKIMRALRTPATVRKHANILQHMLGYLRHHVDDADRKALAGLIDDYRRELVPLIVPVTLLRHYAEKHGIPYLKDQYYLNPHPIELTLRCHA